MGKRDGKANLSLQSRRQQKPVRRRRTAEDATRSILDAAEKRLIKGGPEAVRLQDIADDIGISPPAILHHFSSREGLLEALAQHVSNRLQEAMIRTLVTQRINGSTPNHLELIAQLLELGFQGSAGQGYARLWAWLILSGRDLRSLVEGLFNGLAQVIHAARVQWSQEEGLPIPPFADTQFGMLLGITTLLGEALCDPYAQLMVGLPGDAETGQQFRLWLARLFAEHDPLRSTLTEPEN